MGLVFFFFFLGQLDRISNQFRFDSIRSFCSFRRYFFLSLEILKRELNISSNYLYSYVQQSIYVLLSISLIEFLKQRSFGSSYLRLVRVNIAECREGGRR